MVERADFPTDIHFSLAPVLKKLEKRMHGTSSSISKNYMQAILDYADEYPRLQEGIQDVEELKKYKDEIHTILENLFPAVLTKNEIKAAALPFDMTIFNPTARFKQILEDAGADYSLNLRNLDEQSRYIFICIIILNEYYNYTFDFSKPLFIDIPNKNGLTRHYRMSINADFVSLKPKKNAIEITNEIAESLIKNVNDIELWKQYFPANSWIMSGIVILNLTDITIEDAISDLKSTLLFNRDLEGANDYFKF